MNNFFESNDAKYRILRTIVQGLIGILIANIDFLVGLKFDGTIKTIIVGVVMVILSPIMAELGNKIEEKHRSE